MLPTRNVGTIDRIIRTIPAVAVAIAWYGGSIAGWLAIGLAVAAGLLLVTGLLGSCSIYYMLGFSTCPISGAPRPQDR
jgi:hypothetical protein